MGHALLSPSKAARWLNCLPSARLEAEIPDTPSPYAEEGTLAHALAENELNYLANYISEAEYKANKNSLRDSDLFEFDMLDYVQRYVDFVLDLCAEEHTSTKLFVEQKLDLTRYVPDCYGTADAIVVSDNTLHIIDLKYGKGVKVDAFENPQLKLYALGALDFVSVLYDISNVTLNIVQPRLNHIDTYSISKTDLLDWAFTVSKRATLAFVGAGKTQSGTWCKFCKCNPNCKALADKQLEIAKYDFKQADFLTDKELVDIFKRSKAFKEWIDAVNEYIKDLLTQGGSIKGLKLVNSSTRRAWRDEVADQKAIEAATKEAGLSIDILYDDPVVKSFSKIEKTVGKKVFEKVYSKFIKSTEYKAVALESDKRSAAVSSVDEDFLL
jgi:hypothetical protein